MFLKADRDLYGNSEHLTSDDFRHILDLVDNYKKSPYAIREIRRDDVKDPHGRIDIEILYINENKDLICQKLLILDGELLDGEMFHKKWRERRLENE